MSAQVPDERADILARCDSALDTARRVMAGEAVPDHGDLTFRLRSAVLRACISSRNLSGATVVEVYLDRLVSEVLEVVGSTSGECPVCRKAGVVHDADQD